VFFLLVSVARPGLFSSSCVVEGREKTVTEGKAEPDHSPSGVPGGGTNSMSEPGLRAQNDREKH